jgi:hypothetical protein
VVLAAADLEKQQTQLEIQAGPILAAVLEVVELPLVVMLTVAQAAPA